VVRRPRAGAWTFTKSDPTARVRVLSQQFFPRGTLVEPTAARPVSQHAKVTIGYRLDDDAGRPLRELDGRRFEGARRRGKWLLFPTKDGELQLRIHLMSAGRIRHQAAGKKGPKMPAFRLRFEDGGELKADAVIWATGYRPDYSWIDLPIFDSDGRLRHRRGVTDVPGLYFLGLTWQHTRGSALIGWVKDDAEYIAEQISRRVEAPARAAASA